MATRKRDSKKGPQQKEPTAKEGTIGYVIQKARLSIGMTQDALAESSGVSQSQIAIIERGTVGYEPLATSLFGLAKA